MSLLSLELQQQRDILRQRLAAHGQEHLLRFADVLDDASFTKLAEDISEVDFEQLSQIVALSLAPASSAPPSEPVPLPSASMLLSRDLSPCERSALFAVGLQHVAQSHVALIILAGGQGTRLGTEDPKGCYDIGLPSHSSLFQLQVARTLKLSALAGSGCVPVYIMTSPMTHAATVKFFEDNAFFGCDRLNVTFFQQGTLPCVDRHGKVLLQDKCTIARAPDGNGGIYRALRTSGALADMQARGVRFVHVTSIDNCIVKCCDPVMIAAFAKAAAECGAKVCPKTGPHEAVGVFATVNGRVKVVEYSEISAETATATDADGRLLFNAGNICNHVYTTACLHAFSTAAIPYHVAHKKIPAADESGNSHTPASNNGIKLESFIFDVFEMVPPSSFFCMEVQRAEEFAPVKNASGVDSPASARAAVDSLHRSWVAAAGGKVEGDGVIEVLGSCSYAGEGLDGLCAEKAFTAPALLQ